jgi:hypothetical protein
MYLKPHLLNKKQKIRKTLSDPSTIDQHIKHGTGKQKNKTKLLSKRNKNQIGSMKLSNFESGKKSVQSKLTFNKSKIISKNSSISSINRGNEPDIINLVTSQKADGSHYYSRKKNSF